MNNGIVVGGSIGSGNGGDDGLVNSPPSSSGNAGTRLELVERLTRLYAGGGNDSSPSPSAGDINEMNSSQPGEGVQQTKEKTVPTQEGDKTAISQSQQLEEELTPCENQEQRSQRTWSQMKLPGRAREQDRRGWEQMQLNFQRGEKTQLQQDTNRMLSSDEDDDMDTKNEPHKPGDDNHVPEDSRRHSKILPPSSLPESLTLNTAVSSSSVALSTQVNNTTQYTNVRAQEEDGSNGEGPLSVSGDGDTRSGDTGGGGMPEDNGGDPPSSVFQYQGITPSIIKGKENGPRDCCPSSSDDNSEVMRSMKRLALKRESESNNESGGDGMDTDESNCESGDVGLDIESVATGASGLGPVKRKGGSDAADIMSRGYKSKKKRSKYQQSTTDSIHDSSESDDDDNNVDNNVDTVDNEDGARREELEHKTVVETSLRVENNYNSGDKDAVVDSPGIVSIILFLLFLVKYSFHVLKSSLSLLRLYRQPPHPADAFGATITVSNSSRPVRSTRSFSVALFTRWDFWYAGEIPLLAELYGKKLLRPLTKEEQHKVNSAIHGSGQLNEIVAGHGADSVKRGSIQTLQPNTWLDDEVVNYFLKEFLAKQPGRRRCHYFSSFFYQTLFDEKNLNPSLRGKYNYKNVKRWGRKCGVPNGDMFALDLLFIPINIDNMHWVLAVVFMKERVIRYYDSMGDTDRSKLEGLLQYLKDEHKARKGTELDESEWTLMPCTMDTPRQRDGKCWGDLCMICVSLDCWILTPFFFSLYPGFNCGVAVCLFCDIISRDFPTQFFKTEHITAYRRLIALSILGGKI